MYVQCYNIFPTEDIYQDVFICFLSVDTSDKEGEGN